MTQVLFDLSYLDAFLERLGGASPIPLLVGVWPLPSHELALRLHNEVPGIVVPDHGAGAARAAGADAPEVGRELARELIAEAREKAAGVYVVAPFRQPLGVARRARASATQAPVDDARPAGAPSSASRTSSLGTP